MEEAILTRASLPKNTARASVKNANLIKLVTGGKTSYPVTNSDAVLVFTEDGLAEKLTDILNPLLYTDEVPTENSTNFVTSGGIYKEFEDTIGVLYTNMKMI